MIEICNFEKSSSDVKSLHILINVDNNPPLQILNLLQLVVDLHIAASTADDIVINTVV